MSTFLSYTSYDGSRISYQRAGRGEPLVVLPGGPGMAPGYLGDLGGLGRRRTLVLVHPRAAGRSDVPADRNTVSFVRQASDVEALRRHLGLERIDLLAHSAGCLTAQEYLAAHPDRVRRAVLAAPVGRAAREADEAELAALRASRSGEPWFADAAEADRLLAEGGAGTAEPAALQRRVLPFFWHTWTADTAAEYRPEHACSLPWYREAFYAGSAAPAELRDRLARFTAAATPVLVLAGAFDGMIGTNPARAVAACHPRARLEVLARSGHRMWAEEPERFVGLVEEFLAAGEAPVTGGLLSPSPR
ncbi:alpha/beta hydrolase [Kitasatospora sp. NPDC048722]|uniref:alpha/beta fold hydrolase n=1 Tax=Kitasatospora sp. NPDC048722 TaxID=3155639 RepID=UPI00340BCA8D